MINNSRLLFYIPFLIVLLNTIVKGIFIESTSIAGDEPFSIFHAQMDIGAIIELLRQGNNPPFYELFLHYWIKLFGISELAVRIPSLVFSSLTCLYLFKTGKRFFNIRVGLVASIIYIFSNYHILLSHEARGYALLGMLAVMSMYCFLKIVNEQASKTSFFLLAIINGILLYTHYFSLFLIVLQATLFILNPRIRNKSLRPFIFYGTSLTILYLPNLMVLFHRFMDSSSKGTWLRPPRGLEDLYNRIWAFSNSPVVTVLCILILVISAILWLKNRSLKGENSLNRNIIFLWFWGPFLLMFTISFWIPMFLDRYLMFFAVAYPLVLSIIADRITKKPMYRNSILSVLSILFIVSVKPNIGNKRKVAETVEKISELKNENCLVVICPENFLINYLYYENRNLFALAENELSFESIKKLAQEQNIMAVNSIQDIPLNSFNQVLYLDAAANFSFPNNNIVHDLEQEYNLKEKHFFYEIFNVYDFHKRK